MTTERHQEHHDTRAARINPSPGVITVWSDIGCPWASLALHTLRAAINQDPTPIHIDHRAFPLELFNHRPTPKVLLDTELAAIAGIDPSLGWRPWSAPEWTYPGTTLPALEAIQTAKDPEVGGLPASDQLDEALRRAWFAESRCVSIHGVILNVAAECDRVDAEALADRLTRGAGRAAVYHQWSTASGPGVQGSPHLFTPSLALHNPGVSYSWTGRPGEGYLRVDSHDPSWAEPLIATTAAPDPHA